jgi:tetratricopeptide (TPR) repeat protein
MAYPRPAVHRTIIVVDVERFGDARRTNPHQVAVRDGLWHALEQAFGDAGIRWAGCRRDDRGDGVLILAPVQVPKGRFAESLPTALAAALREHNRGRCAEERIRLRMAVHAGEVCRDTHGVAGTAVNAAFRLLEAEPLKRALASSSGVLAVIASQWFFEEVIRHTPASAPARYRRVHVSVKETSTTAWICLPDDPYPPQPDAALPTAPTVAAPRQLPAATAGFTGRAAELAALSDLLQEPAAGGTMMISAVGGTAGIGKTALAVHWAHQVADRFPDGQLYVNLRGFDPAGPPMTPAEAVRGFLDAFEVPPERIPVSLDAQAALYRSLLAGRRVLVVLDNARDAGQVRPLLPGSPGCVVVVTSRNRLTSLIAAEGARPLTLDLLTLEEARHLLACRIGAGRVAAEPPAVDEIIASCARLPLALSIVAARAAVHPAFRLAALAGELRDARGGLEAFHSGEVAADVRAVFSWSYHQLSTETARLFRLLGLHPGPDISAPAAASLAALPAGHARSALAELARAHLVTEHAPGRFAFHDLLRAYATEQARAHDAEDDQQAAVRRMLDHYLHTAHTATALSRHPRWEPLTLPSPQPGVIPEQPADCTAALAWFEAEHPVLLAVIPQAAAGWDISAWQLPWTLMDYFDRRGHWHDWAATQHAALDAARRHTDRQGQAHAHEGIGYAYGSLGRYDDARDHLQQALALFGELGDQAGQAYTHTDLGWVLQHAGCLADSLRHAQQAVVLFRALGHRHGQARALNSCGWYNALLGDHRQALTCCEQALALQRDLGDRRGEAYTLDSLGYACHHLGHHQQAITYYQQSLALNDALGESYGKAVVLSHLGDACHAAGDLAAARAAWQNALDILDQLGHVPGPSPGLPDASQIRVKLLVSGVIS